MIEGVNMKLNNKGFAITSIVYAMLILFLVLILLIMSNMASRKALFDKEKSEVLSGLESKLPLPKICVLENREAYQPGAQYRCVLNGESKTFYLLENIEDENKVALIAANDLSGVSTTWCGDATRCQDDAGNFVNTKGPLTALDALDENTQSWKSIQQISEITLPSAEQIAAAGGVQEWTQSSNINYSLPEWLRGYYWTSTESTKWNYIPWAVRNEVLTGNMYRINTNLTGIRPVIVISKDYIKV